MPQAIFQCAVCAEFVSDIVPHVRNHDISRQRLDAKTFATSRSLNRHQSRHAGDKPHSFLEEHADAVKTEGIHILCHLCGEIVTSSSCWLQHQEVISIFGCAACGHRFFRSRFDVLEHILRRHRDRPLTATVDETSAAVASLQAEEQRLDRTIAEVAEGLDRRGGPADPSLPGKRCHDAALSEYADLQPDQQRPDNPPFGTEQGDVIVPPHNPVLDNYISAVVPPQDQNVCTVVEEFHQQVAARQKRGPKKIQTTPQLLAAVRKAAKEVNPEAKIGLFGVSEKRLKGDVTQQLIAKVQADVPDADPKLIVKKAMGTGHYRRGTSRKPKKPKAKTLSQLADEGIDTPDTRETLKLMAERHPFFQLVLDQMAAGPFN